MTERIKKLITELKSKEYTKERIADELVIKKTDSDEINAAMQLKATLEREEPFYVSRDRIGFYRKYKKSADFINTDNEFTSDFNKEKKARPFATSGNVVPNYKRVITDGFDKILATLNSKEAVTQKEKEFKEAATLSLEAISDYCKEMRVQAEKKGNSDLAKVLLKIPSKGAETYYEALVFLKILVFALRCNNIGHMPLGRFDQYMYPFYLNSIKAGATRDELFELTEEFFISLNFDVDLYLGMQVGDNGQSMVLGGYDLDGNCYYNELSDICLDASLELNLIDPKINVRVSKNTPDELFEKCTQLTAKGLGFPQYLNDDVVIPGLMAWGYDQKDAENYAVAACWEFIPSGNGMDIPNMQTLNYPMAVNNAMYKHLKNCRTFEEFMGFVKEEINEQCNNLIKACDELFEKGSGYLCPSPLLSVTLDGCIESLTDLNDLGTKYYNVGFHGAGLSNGADTLAAIKQKVFEGNLSADTLLKALDSNFEGFEDLQKELLECPKMGNNDDYADDLGSELMDMFVDALKGRKNAKGGIYRPGTGSAMDYIFAANKVGATADGRRAFEPYASSFTPSMTTVKNGLLSVIQSFTKYDLKKVINGGPLTVEIHHTFLRNDEGIKKVAFIVKEYIKRGGHQLQINSLNREQLIDAKKNPESHKNLIVRVWGWSGYFNELDEVYQDHVIARANYKL